MAIYAMSDIHGMYGSFLRRIKQLNNLESIKTGEDTLIKDSPEGNRYFSLSEDNLLRFISN